MLRFKIDNNCEIPRNETDCSKISQTDLSFEIMIFTKKIILGKYVYENLNKIVEFVFLKYFIVKKKFPV